MHKAVDKQILTTQKPNWEYMSFLPFNLLLNFMF